MRYAFLPMGMLFGFLLSRAGATTYDFYAKLFLLQDFQLLIVMITAGAVAATGIAVLKVTGARSLVGKQPLSFVGKPYTRSLVSGALVFGIGWGIAGACPGTALAMLGEGKVTAGVTLAGMLAGTYLYGKSTSLVAARRLRRDRLQAANRPA